MGSKYRTVLYALMGSHGVLLTAVTAPFNQEKTMTDFQSFRNAVLEDDDLQQQVMSVGTTTSKRVDMQLGISPC